MTEQNTTDREIVITRLIDAPRAKVFDAFTDAEHIGQWWGPNGFTITTLQADIRVGGEWRFVMHGPDGTDYPNNIRYTEITTPERIEVEHGADDGGDAHFHATFTFEDRDGKTHLTMRSLFPTAEARNNAVEKYDAIEGGKQTLGRLDAYLANAAK